MDYQKFIQAAGRLEQAAAARRRAQSKALEQDVAQALAREDREGACALIEAFLTRQPGIAHWWHELAVLRWQRDDRDGARLSWRRALALSRGDVPLLGRIAQAVRAEGEDPVVLAETVDGPSDSMRALQAAERAILGNDWATALPGFVDAMQAQPADAQACRNLVSVLEHLGQPGQARCVEALHLLACGDARAAAAAFEAAPAADARSPRFLADHLRALRYAGEEARAIGIAAQVPAEDVPPLAWTEWADILLDLGRHDEAVDVLRQGGALLGEPVLALQAELLLPSVPESQAALEHAHQRARDNMRALATRPPPDDPAALDRLARALRPNFLLAYLTEACVDEARAYGDFAARVMQARFPQFAAPPPVRERGPGEPVRIGCATSFVNHHVVMKCFAGWLQRPDRGRFEIHLFPLATEANEVTGYLASLVDVFHPPAHDVEQAARQIHDAGLDLLAYPEIGLDGLSFRLAALHLAPVQCVAGGHPMTTGLPTVDYFLSAAAAEPADAASHYSERLVTLPGMGVCMPAPVVPHRGKSRADFGLAPEQVVYLSTQNLFKYVPAFDDVYARIARSVDNAVFVFVEGLFPAWTRTFAGRLQRSFAAHGLDPDHHLRIVPKQDYDDYLALNAASDIFLDPPGGFSGGMTVRDALACGLPVVTLPGPVMRSRQGLGLLAELDIGDTVAADPDDYVRLAVALGKDAAWREALSERILERRSRIFDDARSVEALSAFLRVAAGAPQDGDQAWFGPVLSWGSPT